MHASEMERSGIEPLRFIPAGLYPHIRFFAYTVKNPSAGFPAGQSLQVPQGRTFKSCVSLLICGQQRTASPSTPAGDIIKEKPLQ